MADNFRVLVVDDEEGILDTLRRSLKMAGIRAHTAPGPLRAMDMLRENGYDLVITDIKMPEMTGVEFLQKIKSDNPLTQVIILTGYSNIDYLVDCFEAGAADFFPKPLKNTREIFLEAVRQALKKADRWRSGLSLCDGLKGGVHGQE